MRAIAHSGQDVAAANRLPVNLPWTDVVKTWLGPIDMGMEIENFSAADWWTLDMSTPSLLVCEGVGSVVSSIGKDIPVQTSTPVTTIKWGGAEGVTVETPAGTIQAKAVIVTVSTGVLAAESIQFDPPLPTETVTRDRQSADGPAGKDRPAIRRQHQFRHAPERMARATPGYCSQLSYFLSWPCDTNMMVGFVGGSFAWDLTAAGERAAVDFALGELRRIFGPEVDRSFVAGRFTGWGTDANVRGAYAVAKPGGHTAREHTGEGARRSALFRRRGARRWHGDDRRRCVRERPAGCRHRRARDRMSVITDWPPAPSRGRQRPEPPPRKARGDWYAIVPQSPRR